MAFTNEQITKLNVDNEQEQGARIQSPDYLPVAVDLSTEITIGRAILNAIQSDPLLLAQFSDPSEEAIIKSIVTIAFADPDTTVDTLILAYSGATAHVRKLTAGGSHCIPAVRIWRKYATGPASIVLDLLIDVK